MTPLINPEATIMEFDERSAGAIIARALPLPADDQMIGGEMSKLCTLMKNHVQSY